MISACAGGPDSKEGLIMIADRQKPHCPRVTIDLTKLKANATRIIRACRRHGIEVTGVAKGVASHPAVVSALVEAGIASLGDSRLANLKRIRTLDLGVETVLLRLPQPSMAAAVVELADVSLNSEAVTLQALDRAAAAAGKVHGVILMVDVGDLREGAMPGDVAELARVAEQLPRIMVRGVGTNLACYGGVKPDRTHMTLLLEARDRVADVLGYEPSLVSGGNSANWLLMESGRMPVGINHLRLGEAILLGTEATEGRLISGMAVDIFRLDAEVIEVKIKPTVPQGEIGKDSFGDTPTFADRGERLRAIVAVGRQDVVPTGLVPTLPGVEIIGASSDHMILDVHAAKKAPQVGEILSFTVTGYSALLALFTSTYAAKTSHG